MESGKINNSGIERHPPKLDIKPYKGASKTIPKDEVETINPIAHPFFSKGKRPPIKEKIMIVKIRAPVPIRSQKKATEMKSGPKKRPNAPVPWSATPKRSRDFSRNLIVKATMAKPKISPDMPTSETSWLAVPMGTLSEEATSTRSVVKITIPADPRKAVRTKKGRSSFVLRLLST